MHIELKRNEIALKRDKSHLGGIKSHAKNSDHTDDSIFIKKEEDLKKTLYFRHSS